MNFIKTNFTNFIITLSLICTYLSPPMISAANAINNNQLKAENKISKLVLKEMNKGSNQDLSVLVYLKEQASLFNSKHFLKKEEKGLFVYKSLTRIANKSQHDLILWLMENKINYQRFYIVNMIALFNVNKQIIDSIASREDVSKIVLNSKFVALPETKFREQLVLVSDDNSGIGSNIISTGANRVWKELKVRGEGMVIAGQDTGVDWRHPALIGQYRGINQDGSIDHAYSWHDSIRSEIFSGSNSCGYDLKAPCDDDQHGTHTMGTMVGSDGETNQIGMAPAAKWIACRNMNEGVGRPSTYIECFEWFLAPYPPGGNPLVRGRPEKAPHIINNSWGCPEDEGCKDAEILPILKTLKAAGIMVVAAAGNDGASCGTIKDAPAMHSDDSLSVGAHDHNSGNIASFSSRGPSAYDGKIGPDISAPGVNIRSSIPGGGYAGFFWSGTSMAAPHVVGEIALLWSARKDLIGKIEETVNIIKNSATAKNSSENCGGVAGNKVPNNTYGQGLINAYRAIKGPKNEANH